MNLTFCNTTAEYERIEEDPLWHNITFHHLGLIFSAAFGAFSIVVSLVLIIQHATHYSRPWEQRHILRILFMIPVYSFVSFLSYYWYRHTVYFEVIRDCYEAFAIASFFALLCHYTAPDLHGQKDYFRALRPGPWIWPVSWLYKCSGKDRGPFRTPRSGLTWFNVIWFCVFQYCFIRVSMTVTAVITQVADRYCLDSLSPAFAHVWITVIEAISVTVAMICLIQFYVQLRHDLVEHRPFLKLLAIKLVVFLVFWQTILINFLTSSGAIQPSATIATPDVKIGIPAMLICLEMAIFSVLHIWAYPWKVYRINLISQPTEHISPLKSSYLGGPLGFKAYLDAFNPWDIIKAIGRAFKWIAIGRRRRQEDISYKTNLGETVLEDRQGGKPGKYQPVNNDEGVWDARPYENEQMPLTARPYGSSVENNQPVAGHPFPHNDRWNTTTSQDDNFQHVQIDGVDSQPPGATLRQDTSYHNQIPHQSQGAPNVGYEDHPSVHMPDPHGGRRMG